MKHSLEFVRSVLRKRRQEIMDRYRAAGLGIGARPDDPKSHIIVVFLQSEKERPVAPVDVDEVPLVFEVTGKFKPYKK